MRTIDVSFRCIIAGRDVLCQSAWARDNLKLHWVQIATCRQCCDQLWCIFCPLLFPVWRKPCGRCTLVYAAHTSWHAPTCAR